MKTDKIIFENEPRFAPDYSPAQMIVLGVFGGNYFAYEHYKEDYSIESNIGLKLIEDIFEIHNIDKNILQYSLFSKYNVNKNYFKVKCGSELWQWLDRGWIFEEDPYGWFEWYIKFYYGRRSYMDRTQINRWLNFKSRHSGMLKSHCQSHEVKKSLKTRQNLLHWAIDSTKV